MSEPTTSPVALDYEPVTVRAVPVNEAEFEVELAKLRAVSWRALCPGCGYSRVGLDSEGRCPECGWEPSPVEIILFAQAMSGTTDWDWRTLYHSIAAQAVLVVVAMVGLAVVCVAAARWIGVSEGIGLGVGTAAAFGAARLLTRLRSPQLPGEFQLRVAPNGFAVLIGVGQPAWRPWPKQGCVRIDQVLFGKCRFRICATAGKLSRDLVQGHVIIAPELCTSLERVCSYWINLSAHGP